MSVILAIKVVPSQSVISKCL